MKKKIKSVQTANSGIAAFIGVMSNGDLFLVMQEGAGSAYYAISRYESKLSCKKLLKMYPSSQYFNLEL